MSRFSRFFELCVHEVVFAAALGCVVQSVKVSCLQAEPIKRGRAAEWRHLSKTGLHQGVQG